MLLQYAKKKLGVETGNVAIARHDCMCSPNLDCSIALQLSKNTRAVTHHLHCLRVCDDNGIVYRCPLHILGHPTLADACSGTQNKPVYYPGYYWNMSTILGQYNIITNNDINMYTCVEYRYVHYDFITFCDR